MNIVIFGPPGAGKGTQSNFLVSKYKLFQLSTGDLLRKEIKNKSSLGLKINKLINSGSLAPNEMVKELDLADKNLESEKDGKNPLELK